MRTTTDAGFDTEVLGGGTVLVDFRADWCGPCRQLAPVLEALQAELASRLTVLMLNVDDSPETTRRYGVAGLPALILFVDGEPVHRVLGLRPKGALRAELEPWIP